jgi:hypothetical protein
MVRGGFVAGCCEVLSVAGHELCLRVCEGLRSNCQHVSLLLHAA